MSTYVHFTSTSFFNNAYYAMRQEWITTNNPRSFLEWMRMVCVNVDHLSWLANIDHDGPREMCYVLSIWKRLRTNVLYTEEWDTIFSKIKPVLYRAYLQDQCSRTLFPFLDVLTDKEYEQLYDIFSGLVEPSLDTSYSSMMCYYVAMYVHYYKTDKHFTQEPFLQKGAQYTDDPHHVWCLDKLAHIHPNEQGIQYARQAWKQRHLPSLHYLLSQTQEKHPKYMYQAAMIVRDHVKHPSETLCGVERSSPMFAYMSDIVVRKLKSVVRNKDSPLASIYYYGGYLHVWNEYEKALAHFTLDHPVYEKYLLSPSALLETNTLLRTLKEQYDAYDQHMQTMYNALHKEMNASHLVNNVYSYETLNPMIEEIHTYRDTSMQQQTPIHDVVEYWEIEYFRYRLKKYTTKLHEEIQYLPDVGSLYQKAKEDFEKRSV